MSDAVFVTLTVVGFACLFVAGYHARGYVRAHLKDARWPFGSRASYDLMVCTRDSSREVACEMLAEKANEIDRLNERIAKADAEAERLLNLSKYWQSHSDDYKAMGIRAERYLGDVLSERAARDYLEEVRLQAVGAMLTDAKAAFHAPKAKKAAPAKKRRRS